MIGEETEEAVKYREISYKFQTTGRVDFDDTWYLLDQLLLQIKNLDSSFECEEKIEALTQEVDDLTTEVEDKDELIYDLESKVDEKIVRIKELLKELENSSKDD